MVANAEEKVSEEAFIPIYHVMLYVVVECARNTTLNQLAKAIAQCGTAWKTGRLERACRKQNARAVCATSSCQTGSVNADKATRITVLHAAQGALSWPFSPVTIHSRLHLHPRSLFLRHQLLSVSVESAVKSDSQALKKAEVRG